MSRTDVVVHELKQAVMTGEDVEEVLRRHEDSKSVLYRALAEVLPWAGAELTSAAANLESRLDAKAQVGRDIESLTPVRDGLQAEIDRHRQESAELTDRLEGRRAERDQLDQLGAWGFHPERLAELREFVERLSAEQGVLPEDAAAEVFAFLGRYEGVASLDVEARRAERRAEEARAEASRWSAEARRREAHTKLRIATIDATERLLARGVKEPDIARWHRILDRAGLTPSKLARELERLGSLEKACRERERKLQGLDKRVEETTARLDSLRKTERRTKASIAAVEANAVGTMREMSDEAVEQIRRLAIEARECGRLHEEASTLAPEITLARAIRSMRPDDLREIPRPLIRRLANTLVEWVKLTGYNPQVPMTRPVRAAWNRAMVTHTLSLEDLMLWAFRGFFTEQELRSV